MPEAFFEILIYGACFLAGSLPFAVWVGKLFFGVDVRQHGSGNPGATNTLRTIGKRAAIVVLLLDIGKGCLGVLLPYFFIKNSGLTHEETMALGGGLAILGHIYSPFLGFKGGKGVATTVGVILALHPTYGAIILLIFLLVLVLTKYVSLGSMLAAVVYAALVLILKNESVFLSVFAVCLALMIVYKHKSNIQRIINGTENKFSLRKSKPAEAQNN